MYDRYNDVNRQVPLNGDIAGLMARATNTNDAWWSPAGYNRGNIKNCIKLSYIQTQSIRDALYQAGINPVISPQSQGPILYGDKTMQTKPSAFDRIGVRRLFIVLEKAIATFAKFDLFEFNDDITRSQFVNTVSPFLSTIEGRRGIVKYKVICDGTNNTTDVIGSENFVASILILPNFSINYIALNFVATNNAVQFDETVVR
jgi:phage tail sheath protein FI